MSPLDEAFAHAIYDAVIRRWITLAYLLDAEVKDGFAKVEPRMKAVLLCGAAQILLMDRVPAHASINHAVEWAKRMVRPGAAAMVNAVLRRIAGLRNPEAAPRERATDRPDELPLADGRALALTRPCLPDDPLERLAIATAHPVMLLRHWARYVPMPAVRARALHTLVEPPIILNTAHAAPDSLATIPAEHLHPHAIEGLSIFSGPHSVLVQALDARTDFWVQDPSSAAAIRSVAHLRPRFIIDMCAGQGTKTRQLAHTFPDAEIIATDIEPIRFATLQKTLHGFDGGRVKVEAMGALKSRFGYADLILLDVPCSNTGVLARRPEARYRFSPESLASLADVQRQIVADSLTLLSDTPGKLGSILYATCSLEPEEGPELAKWAAKWHKFKSHAERKTDPLGMPGEPPRTYHDGAYSVLLTR